MCTSRWYAGTRNSTALLPVSHTLFQLSRKPAARDPDGFIRCLCLGDGIAGRRALPRACSLSSLSACCAERQHLRGLEQLPSTSPTYHARRSSAPRNPHFYNPVNPPKRRSPTAKRPHLECGQKPAQTFAAPPPPHPRTTASPPWIHPVRLKFIAVRSRDHPSTGPLRPPLSPHLPSLVQPIKAPVVCPRSPSRPPCHPRRYNPLPRRISPRHINLSRDNLPHTEYPPRLYRVPQRKPQTRHGTSALYILRRQQASRHRRADNKSSGSRVTSTDLIGLVRALPRRRRRSY